jgi:hypothetical protein
MIFVILAKKKYSEDNSDPSKHAAVLMIYKLLFIYVYIVHLLFWLINIYTVFSTHKHFPNKKPLFYATRYYLHLQYKLGPTPTVIEALRI